MADPKPDNSRPTEGSLKPPLKIQENVESLSVSLSNQIEVLAAELQSRGWVVLEP